MVKKGQIILFFSVAFRRHFVLLVPVPLGSCYKLVVMVVLHDALCFTDMDDLDVAVFPYTIMSYYHLWKA